MTDSNRAVLVFSNLGRRKIQADFQGGELTSDAGAALLREVDRRIGLIDALADCISDPRQPAKITHDLRTMLAQRILAIALGYEDLNDHDSLRDDPLLQILTERNQLHPAADAYVLKPIDAHSLLACVAELINQLPTPIPSPANLKNTSFAAQF